MLLKDFRKKAGLSQDEVAKKLGVHNTTYGNWELQKTEPDIKNLSKLADIFHTTVDNIIGRPTNLVNKMLWSPTDQSIIEKVLSMNDKQKELTEYYIDILLQNTM